MHHPDFDQVLTDALKVYESHRAVKNESWRTIKMGYLAAKLSVEWNEFIKSETIDQDYKEILDMINVALMLGERLRMKGASLK